MVLNTDFYQTMTQIKSCRFQWENLTTLQIFTTFHISQKQLRNETKLRNGIKIETLHRVHISLKGWNCNYQARTQNPALSHKPKSLLCQPATLV